MVVMIKSPGLGLLAEMARVVSARMLALAVRAK